MREVSPRKWSFRYLSHGSDSGFSNHIPDAIRRPFLKSPARSSALLFLFILFIIAGAFVSTRLLDSDSFVESSTDGPVLKTSLPFKKVEFPLDCNALNLTGKCPTTYPTGQDGLDRPPAPTCPEYFRWIHEDLRPWAYTGITREMVARAKRTANFLLVIKNGKAYVKKYEKGFQSRDDYTLWGILQLLRRYPSRIPDLELMFDCVDWPVIKSSDHAGPSAPPPPPLFRYCADNETLDIVFPDWSFWGWPEINIKPWEHLVKELMEGNKRTKWLDREPYAYWKGNPEVADTRKDLLKCNISEEHDWGAHVYSQNWVKESKQGYKQSNLSSQCVHRYKIYIEGSAWSVSEKYILACNSVTFLVKPHYYDFFTRGLMPLQHYWPIKENDKCRSIKHAVAWGNSHVIEAENIGKAGSKFIENELKMDYVYDYMFHLLNEYAKLLRFRPTIPRDAVELCPETMACRAEGLYKKFMIESLVKSPSNGGPCTMPPSYDPPSLLSVLKRKNASIAQVDISEHKFWMNQPNQKIT